tara:strand:+ start:186 stop:647 length:462 start_codon:yes stop_codon:yes gene_type:complete
MDNLKLGQSKIRLLPEQTLFNQGDDGNKAYLINQGILDVIVDEKRVGYMSEGEFFGELALILNQKRSATIVARNACELIVIDKEIFNQLIETASSEVKAIILSLCEELSKRTKINLQISKADLENKIQDENPIVSSITRQIFFRLDKSTKHVE